MWSLRLSPLMVVLVLSLLAPGSAAVVYSDHGPDIDRPGHCGETNGATWKPPGIETIHQLEGGLQSYGSVMVLPNGVPTDPGEIWFILQSKGYQVVDANTSEFVPGVAGGGRSTAWVEDVDQDGDLEIVEGGLHGQLGLRDVATREVQATWSLDVGPLAYQRGIEPGPPRDVLPEAGLETPVGESNGIYILSRDGEELAFLATDPEPAAPPRFVREGREVFLYVFQSNWAEAEPPNARLTKLAIVENGIDPLNPRPYLLEPVWSTELGEGVIAQPIAHVDLDHDGENEWVIPFGSYPHRMEAPAPAVRIVTDDGRIIGEFETGSVNALAAGDLDGDGTDEVAFAIGQTYEEFPETPWLDTHSSALLTLDHDGKYKIVSNETGPGVITGIAACDVDGDGVDELALATGHQALTFKRHDHGKGRWEVRDDDGSLMWSHDSANGKPVRVTFADHDHDGDLDLFSSTTALLGYHFDPSADPRQAAYTEYLALNERNNWPLDMVPPEKPAAIESEPAAEESPALGTIVALGWLLLCGAFLRQRPRP